LNFEWEPSKNLANIKKHGISFQEAIFVFADRQAISLPDDLHSDDEERWHTIGQIPNTSIVVVVHSERIRGNQSYVRII